MVKNRRYSAASTLWIGCILALAAAALLGERAAAQQQPSKLLFLTHAGLYKHTSLGPAERAVTSWGQRAGFEVTTLQGYLQDAESLDLSIISAEYLAQFDGVMMMTNGNLPLTDSQKSALIDFVNDGGGFVGVTDRRYWPKLVRQLGRYAGRGRLARWRAPRPNDRELRVFDGMSVAHQTTPQPLTRPRAMPREGQLEAIHYRSKSTFCVAWTTPSASRRTRYTPPLYSVTPR